MTEPTVHRRNFLLHLQERPGYDGSVLLKEPAREQPSPSQLDQLHNEYAVTRQLADATGVRQALAKEGTESRPVLLLEYIEGQTLAELVRTGSLDVADKLRLALRVVRALSRVHDHQVTHKDVSSGNILVASRKDSPGSEGGVYLIDFGLASTVRREIPARMAPDDTLVGTLAYVSPEQTGRMNRQVDYRTDLYSLGICLYEMFTGQLPFTGSDALEIIHAHIAREPQPPHEVDSGIPRPVSDIVLKLLAKNAEDRYQTTAGLANDLEKYSSRLQDSGRVEPFELGADDFSGRLQIPQRLYGRDAEIEQLRAVLDRAVAGPAQLLLVAGYSGIGKTALVHEMQKDVISKQGIFVEGKFDQLQRTLPYLAWAQTLTQLVNNWLTGSESSLAGWRDAILDAVGDNGQVLIDVIPALERIIGPQPGVPSLSGLENRNRFNYTFNRFISGIASPEQPLVVFLDDLQWIDPASLNLIESLLTVRHTSGLLVIGAYRDNEVGADHPLAISQERMQAKSDQVTVITLADLAAIDVDHLLADTLRLTVVDCRELGQALVDKTAGNPFFFRQQLYALESEELLSFDSEQRRWVWEEDLQQRLQAVGNVVDLMIGKIQGLPFETQHILSMASCLGSRFKTSALGTITRRSRENILSDLTPALQSDLVLRQDGEFSFLHDRIQEAGYSLIPQADLPRMHLEIGRALLANTADEDLSQEIFDIVGHLNAGRTLLEAEAEKLDLAVLNLKAGQKAKSASAFSDASAYFEIAIDLLGPESWRGRYDLTLSLHNELGEVTSYLGRYEQLEPIVDLIHENARSVMDRIRISMAQINAASATGDLVLSVEIGLQILDQLGFEIPAQPSPEEFRRLQHRYLELLKGRPDEVIAGLPKMTDEKALAASTIIISILTATFATNPDVYCFLGFTGGILTLEYGVFPWSPHFFGQLGSVLWVAEDHGTPADHVLDSLLWFRQIQDVVLDMVEDPFFKPSSARALEGVYHIGAYCRPIEEITELARRALYAGFEVGDLLFAAHGPLFIAMYDFVSGKNLDESRSQMIEYVQLLGEVNQTLFATWTANYLQAGVSFMEPSEEPQRLIGRYFDEDAFLSAAEAANDISGRHFYYAIRLMVTYHFDVDHELPELMIESEKFIHAGQGLMTTAITRVYSALSKLRLYPTLTPQNQEEAMNKVDQSLQLMEIWSQSAPTTFQHMYDLIRAEKARVLGETDKALAHYEQAIQGANKVGFTHDEALANELYARFWTDRDDERFAAPLMREAHSLYQKWGARAKAKHLATRYPEWLVSRRIVSDEPAGQTTSTETESDLDLRTVLKASQDIAGELALGSLVARLMSNVIESSGAQKGCLILKQAGHWTIISEVSLEDSQPHTPVPRRIDEADALPRGVVHYVARTQETVALEDASESGDFVHDPYVRTHHARSILCLPLVNQGKTTAILYLENNLAPGVFSAKRISLLRLLSSQIAISIDNAQTHAELESLLEARSKALASAEAQVRSLFEDSPLGIALTSYEGRIVSANKAVLQMLRISEEEFLQHQVLDFYSERTDRETLLRQLDEAGFVQDFGVEVRRYDGSTFNASLNLSKLVLEGNEVLLAMVEDVTGQITAEQEAATLEERARLARELHDSVSQTLLSASLLTDATVRSAADGRTIETRDLKKLRDLLHGAVDEMRSLLLELRPAAAGERTLGQLLSPLVEVARTRSQTKIDLRIEGDSVLPESVTQQLLRITEESLNNAVRHAEASRITVALVCDPDGVSLRIHDDGCGFDLERIPADRLGLEIMRERAEEIGADLEIQSTIDKGTEVAVTWS